jgi:hypothetical protein
MKLERLRVITTIQVGTINMLQKIWSIVVPQQLTKLPKNQQGTNDNSTYRAKRLKRDNPQKPRILTPFKLYPIPPYQKHRNSLKSRLKRFIINPLYIIAFQ